MNKKIILLLVLVGLIGVGFFFWQMFTAVTPLSPESVQTTIKEQININPDKGDSLDISNQNLDKLPAYVLKMSNLEELNISGNKLSGALPAEIHDLKKLRVLNASNNLMTGVPAEVGQLQDLEVLNLANNKLTGLPNELGNLKKLKVLNLSGNNYAKQDLEVIKKGLPATVEIIL